MKKTFVSIKDLEQYLAKTMVDTEVMEFLSLISSALSIGMQKQINNLKEGLHSLKKDKINGIITLAEYQARFSKVNLGVLEFLDGIPELDFHAIVQFSLEKNQGDKAFVERNWTQALEHYSKAKLHFSATAISNEANLELQSSILIAELNLKQDVYLQTSVDIHKEISKLKEVKNPLDSTAYRTNEIRNQIIAKPNSVRVVLFTLFDYEATSLDRKRFWGWAPKYYYLTEESSDRINLASFENLRGNNAIKDVVEESCSYAELNDLQPLLIRDAENCPTGIINKDVENELCVQCEGNGSAKCPECAGGKRECNFCCGEEKVQCTSCHGEKEVVCLKCEGTGLVDGFSCSKCRQKEGFIDCPNCNASGEESCPKCLGHGLVECNRCKGEAILWCNYCDETGGHFGIPFIQNNLAEFSKRICFISDEKMMKYQVVSGSVEEAISPLIHEQVEGNRITTCCRTDFHAFVWPAGNQVTKFCHQLRKELGLNEMNAYPLILKEEVICRVLPFWEFKYYFINDVETEYLAYSFLGEDGLEILFESEDNASDIKSKNSTSVAVRRALSNREQRKIDNKYSEIYAMLYIAKNDGNLNPEEKLALAPELSRIFTSLTKTEQGKILEDMASDAELKIADRVQFSDHSEVLAAFSRIKDYLSSKNIESAELEELKSTVLSLTPKNVNYFRNFFRNPSISFLIIVTLISFILMLLLG